MIDQTKPTRWVHIDGAAGEGGGQVLRTSLALSIITGRSFEITRIRAGRAKPGLARQHMACVEAAQAISAANVDGNHLGSQQLRFSPGACVPGDYRFDIGTAGSTTLVLQTVLMPLLLAEGPSRVTIFGGTHNPMAPPVEFLQETFLPQIARMGAQVSLDCECAGFYPGGGGKIVATIAPVERFEAYRLLEAGALQSITATARLSRLPDHIAERELKVVQQKLKLPGEHMRILHWDKAGGPGNVVQIAVAHEAIREVFTGFGEKAVAAEKVATGVARAVQAYRRSKAPVGEHLADQLLLPMALGRGGRFRTGPLTPHTRTNMRTIEAFIETGFETEQVDTHTWQVLVVTGENG